MNTNPIDLVFEQANLTRYSRNDLIIHVDNILGLNDVNNLLINNEQILNKKQTRPFSSVMVIHKSSNLVSCVCGQKSQQELLKEALERLYISVENKFKISEGKLINKVSYYNEIELEEKIEEWHKGVGQGLTLREYLGLSKEEYQKLCDNY